MPSGDDGLCVTMSMTNDGVDSYPATPYDGHIAHSYRFRDYKKSKGESMLSFPRLERVCVCALAVISTFVFTPPLMVPGYGEVLEPIREH